MKAGNAKNSVASVCVSNYNKLGAVFIFVKEGKIMLGINLGIGYFIEKYKSFADYRCVLAGIVTVGVITTIIDLAVNKVESTVIRWEG